MKILVIEDEKDLAHEIKNFLTKEGYTVAVEFDGDSGLNRILSDEFDIIVLDIMLPEIDGFEILNHIRKEGIPTPVIVLTAKSDTIDRVKGLNLGADDYVIKPFSSVELLARIRAILRRIAGGTSTIITANGISLNIETKEVFIDDKRIDLTPKEYEIVEFLMLNKKKPISKYDIAEHVWGDTYDIISTSNFVEVHIKNIRKKLLKYTDKQIIETERGFGYKIND